MYLTTLTRFNDTQAGSVEEWHFRESVTTLFSSDGGGDFVEALRFVLGVTGASPGSVQLRGQLAIECQPDQEIDLLHLATMAQHGTDTDSELQRVGATAVGLGGKTDLDRLTSKQQQAVAGGASSSGKSHTHSRDQAGAVDDTGAADEAGAANEAGVGDVVLSRTTPAHTGAPPTWHVTALPPAQSNHSEVRLSAPATPESAVVFSKAHWRKTVRTFFPDLLTVDHDTDAPMALMRELISANPESTNRSDSIAWRYLKSGNPHLWPTRKAQRIRDKELNQLTTLMRKYGIAAAAPLENSCPDEPSVAESAHRAQLEVVKMIGQLSSERDQATNRQIDEQTLHAVGQLDVQLEAGRQELLRLHSELHTWRSHLHALGGGTQESTTRGELDVLTEHRHSVAEAEIKRLSLAATHQRHLLDELGQRREGLTQTQAWEERSPGASHDVGERQHSRRHAALALELSVSAELLRRKSLAAGQLAEAKDSEANTSLPTGHSQAAVETYDRDAVIEDLDTRSETASADHDEAAQRGVPRERGQAGKANPSGKPNPAGESSPAGERREREEVDNLAEQLAQRCLRVATFQATGQGRDVESDPDVQGDADVESDTKQTRQQVLAWARHLVAVVKAVDSSRCLPLLVHDFATPYPDGAEWLNHWPEVATEYVTERTRSDETPQLQYVMVMPDPVLSPSDPVSSTPDTPPSSNP